MVWFGVDVKSGGMLQEVGAINGWPVKPAVMLNAPGEGSPLNTPPYEKCTPPAAGEQP